MSYRLADGTMSTDYKIGDEFTHKLHTDIFEFIKDDCTENPWFRSEEKGRTPNSWCFLTPVKPNKDTILINQLRETIKQLEATIKEMEQ
jgi:hypothetical protein